MTHMGMVAGLHINMIRHRQTSLKCVMRTVVNGANTLLWTDPWTNCTSLVDILGRDRYHLSSNKNATISSIIHGGRWNTFTISEERECRMVINQILIISQGS